MYMASAYSASSGMRPWKPFAVRRQETVRTEIDRLGIAHERGVAHEVAHAAVQVSSGRIQVLPIFDADQVGRLHGVEETPVPAGRRSAPEGRVRIFPEILGGEGFEPLVHVVLHPGHRTLAI